MNREIKAKWVEALRSGTYKQGRHALRRANDTYCCLGVLCDLHAKETGARWKGPNWSGHYIYGEEEESGGLPKEVMEWAGLPTDNGLVRLPMWNSQEGCSTLAYKNDYGASFEDIANTIEQHL